MSYQLTERPHKFCFSKNPIRYLVEIGNPEAPGCALDVELYVLPVYASYSISAPGELVTRQTLYPNPDGKVYFYCEDFLNSWLEWDLPSTGDNDIKEVDKQIKKFYIRYRQVTKNNPTPTWASESDNLRIVLKGGIAKEKFDRNNYFINWLPAKKPFLTWQPDKHFIGPEERRYLTYFHHTYNLALPILLSNVEDLRLKARVVYTDGTQVDTLKNFPAFPSAILFHCPAGLEQLGLYGLHPDKQIWFYDVSVVDVNGNVFANPYRLYVDYRKYYDTFSFIYHNSLGGIDTLRIRGDYDLEINLDKTDIQQATGGDFGEVLPTENAVINISKYEVYKGDAGWMNTKAFQDSCQELLLSDNVYRVIFNRWLRVVNMQKSIALRSSDDTKWSFPIQWRYTFDNSQYTPFDTDLGAGSNTETPGPEYGVCVAPGSLTATLDTVDETEAVYDFGWDEIEGAEGYQMQYKKTGDADWTTVNTVSNSTTLPFTNEGDYIWRVRTKCSEDDYSGWTNGPGFNVDLNEAMCTAPSDLAVSLITLEATTGRIRFEWTGVPGISAQILEWRQFGTSVWSSVTVAAGTTNYETDLPKDSQFEWRIRNKCTPTGDNYSGYVYGDTFIPSGLLGTCSSPINLSVVVGPIIEPGRVISFGWSVEIGVGYDIQMREVGSTGPWTVPAVVNDGVAGSTTYFSTIISAINFGKTFQWRVRTQCTGGGYSAWVFGPNFNT